MEKDKYDLALRSMAGAYVALGYVNRDKDYTVDFGNSTKDSIASSVINLACMDYIAFGTPDMVWKRVDNDKSVVLMKMITDEDDFATAEACANGTIDYFKYDDYKCVYTIAHIIFNADSTIRFKKVYNWYDDANGVRKCAEHSYLLPIKDTFDFLNCNGADLKSLIEKQYSEQNKQRLANIENFIWGVADTLRGSFRETDYGNVIIPMTVIARLDAMLDSTRNEVIETYNKIKDNPIAESVKESALKKIARNNFYNTSGYSLESVYRNNDYDTFYDYLNGFSSNIRDILNKLDFFNTIDKLDDVDLISDVVETFYTYRDELRNMAQSDMGTLFENLIRRFSEKDNDGEHFTSPDIVKVCCDMLIDSDVDKIARTNDTYTVYDQTMGTSQMLTVMNGVIKDINSNNTVELYGQEINPKTWAIAAANELMKREYSDETTDSRLKLGNTITNDQFPNAKFDYVISNPPFGVKWDMYNFDTDMDARFAGIGSPAKSDGQMLFTLNGLYHLNDNGRMAIIHNGSPLFSGNAGSGEASIREYIIKNDYLEAIVRLPKDLFYNTGITIYIWVVTKNKKPNRKGKVQLIDAQNMFKPLRKSQGSRRNEITDECRKLIFKALEDFGNDQSYELESDNSKVLVSKVFDNNYFMGEPDAQGRYKWEIPFEKIFYVAEEKEDSETIKARILKLNEKITAGMTSLFGTTEEV